MRIRLAGLFGVTCLLPVIPRSTQRNMTFAGFGGLTVRGTFLLPGSCGGRSRGTPLLGRIFWRLCAGNQEETTGEEGIYDYWGGGHI
jgi:hypothetical protein